MKITTNGDRLWQSLMDLAEIGAYDDEIRTEESSPHPSSWACWSNSARCELWTPMIELTHPVDPQALAMRRTAS